MESEGTNVFDLSNLDFMPMATEMVGEKIRDTPKSEKLGEDWNQFPPLPQDL